MHDVLEREICEVLTRCLRRPRRGASRALDRTCFADAVSGTLRQRGSTLPVEEEWSRRRPAHGCCRRLSLREFNQSQYRYAYAAEM